MTCIRCQAELTPRLLRPSEELCTYCATLTRIEAERGIARLQAYLGKWAAFDGWLTTRERLPAA